MIPRVSVLMAVYNNVHELPRALGGLQSQRFDDFEVVAIDDGSVDGSGALLDQAAAADLRIRVIHQPNGGLMRALRRACGEARGELWARQDGDDVSGPDRLARQVTYLDAHPNAVACGCWSYHVPPAGGALRLQSVPDQSTLLVRYLESGWNPFVHGAMMFRGAAYRGLLHGYRLTPDCEDYDLWLQLSEVGAFGMVTEAEYAWWVNPAGVSARSQALRGPFVALALELHRERRVSGVERTDVTAAMARILQCQVPAGTPAARRSAVAYAGAINALRAGEYARYRGLMHEAAHGEGPWAPRARVRQALGWLAPLLRLAYAWRTRPTPLHYLRRVPAGAPVPAWLIPFLQPSGGPVA